MLKLIAPLNKILSVHISDRDSDSKPENTPVGRTSTPVNTNATSSKTTPSNSRNTITSLLLALPATLSFLKCCLYDITKYYDSRRDSLSGRVNCCSMIGTLNKPKLGPLFSFTFVSFSLEFMPRSCKIVSILGALDKNLAKILTKVFTKMQDSYQEFQEFSHWVRNLILVYSFHFIL